MDVATSKPLVILFLGIFLLASCAPAGVSNPPAESTAGWRFSDLRVLDPSDTSKPDQDILALYTRQIRDTFQIRIDWLELKSKHPEQDIYIAIDDRPGGSDILPWGHHLKLKWDQLVTIPHQGQVKTINSDGKEKSQALPNILHDPALDISVVSLAMLLNPNTHLEVVITDPGSHTISDTANTLNGQKQVPSFAPLILAFWNVFPAQTPAQALRRWNGAHTGPLGSRHGLFWLLDAVSRYRIPIALLDLNNPRSLSALEYMNKLHIIRGLQEQGLLILPNTAEGDPKEAETSLQYNRHIGLSLGMKPHSIVYAPLQHPLPGNFTVAFAVLPKTKHMIASAEYRLIPLPEKATRFSQLDENGLTLNVKKAILETALSRDTHDLIVLGDSLPDSLWADARVASLTFQYIATHPWIRVLNETDLRSFPAVGFSTSLLPCSDLLCSRELLAPKLYTTWGTSLHLDSSQLREKIRQNLHRLPPNNISNLAWETYFMLTNPTENTRLYQLKINQIGQLGHMIAAARWADSPQPINDCSADLDWDGYPECVLASNHVFSSYELDGGRLMFVFVLTENGLSQWIGPSSQQAVGLSDPTEWQPQYGEAGDPAGIPGALIPASPPYPFFHPTIAENQLILRSEDTLQEKIFKINEVGLDIHMRSARTIQTQIPLTLGSIHSNPHIWEDCLFQTKSFLNPACPHLPVIKISGATSRIQTFLESYTWMQQPENPSFEYPPGHYLPFGLTVLKIQSEDEFAVSLQMTQK